MLQAIKGKTGVYVLWDMLTPNELYIGSAVDMAARLMDDKHTIAHEFLLHSDAGNKSRFQFKIYLGSLGDANLESRREVNRSIRVIEQDIMDRHHLVPLRDKLGRAPNSRNTDPALSMDNHEYFRGLYNPTVRQRGKKY